MVTGSATVVSKAVVDSASDVGCEVVDGSGVVPDVGSNVVESGQSSSSSPP